MNGVFGFIIFIIILVFGSMVVMAAILAPKEVYYYFKTLFESSDMGEDFQAELTRRSRTTRQKNVDAMVARMYWQIPKLLRVAASKGETEITVDIKAAFDLCPEISKALIVKLQKNGLKAELKNHSRKSLTISWN